MKIPRLTIPNALAVMLIPAMIFDAYQGYVQLTLGDSFFAALHVTAALMCAWALRYPASWALTRFCLWWIKRQVMRANIEVMQVNMKAIKQLNKQEEKRNDQND